MKQFDSVYEKAKPFLTKAAVLLDNSGPYVSIALEKGQIGWDYCAKYSSTYKPELEILLGICLLFFGGNFVFTLMAFEAFCAIGFEQTKQNIHTLIDSFIVARDVLKKDVDVTTPEEAQALTEKLQKILKALDPDMLSQATQGVLAGVVTVVATLQSSLARTLTLGMSLSNLFLEYSNNLVPFVASYVPTEFQKWIKPAITFVAKTLAFIVAYFVQLWLSIYTACVRGVNLILSGLAQRSYISTEMHKQLANMATAIATVGLVVQVVIIGSLPWYLMLLFAPIVVVERLLMFVAVI